MLKYIIKRIFIFIPTMIVISLAIFVLNLNAPGDPVENMMVQTGGGEGGSLSDKVGNEEAYLKKRAELNLDKPSFYFILTSQAKPDSLYRIPRKWHRDNLARMIHQYGNWDKIAPYYLQVKQIEEESFAIQKDSLNPKTLIKIRQSLGDLYYAHEDKDVKLIFAILETNIPKHTTTAVLQGSFDQLKTKYSSVIDQPTRWKLKVPKISWYGWKNQYHIWITKFMQFDFGDSYQDKKPISSKIMNNIFVTMGFSILSIILTYLIAIPLGVFSARRKGTLSDGVSTTFLFVLYSLPNFWIATLMIIYLCQPQYLNWFPPGGLGIDMISDDMSGFEKFKIQAHHVILPLICWTYGSLAFLSRQMRGGMLNIIGQDYIRTARAKGLPENTVVWKHAFRNSLLPVITLFANIFPLMISGSIVIEIIFNLPGMGFMLLNAIKFPDFPVVFTLVMLTAFLTMIGYLIADILYAIVDPRITYK